MTAAAVVAASEIESPSQRRARIAEQVADARKARDEGIALAESSEHAEWDRRLIDRAIDAFIGSGLTFSANDVRELLPDVRSSLMGSRFVAASAAERIRYVGRTTSTKANTHHKDVGLWVGVTVAENVAADRARRADR